VLIPSGYLRTKLGEAFHQFRIGDTSLAVVGQRDHQTAQSLLTANQGAINQTLLFITLSPDLPP
jgi:hypothetical protein